MDATIKKSFKPEIEAGIPMPAPPTRTRKGPNVGARIVWPLIDMKVGDSLAVPEWCTAVRAMAAVRKQQNIDARTPEGWKFVVLETPAGLRMWRTA